MDGNSFLSFGTSGFLGLGTTSPSSKLSVQSGNAQITGTTTTHALVATSSLFVINSGFKFGVFESGNVGIGTTSPSSLLSVQAGNAQITGTSTSHALVATSTLFVGAQGQLFNVMRNGNVGIGTTSPSALLSVAGNAYFAGAYGLGYGTATSSNVLLDTNLLQLGSSSAATLTINYARTATSTIPDGTINAWSIATSTSIMPTFSMSTFLGTGIASSTVPGRIGIGTTTPESRLSIQGTTATGGLGIAGIHEILTANPPAGGTEFGNRLIAYNSPTNLANTFVANFVRIIDDSGIANTARGMEIQSGSGTTTLGVNTGLFSLAKTFGLQGITTGTAGGNLIPAGVFAENRATSTGQALRVYTGTSTTADLALLYQDGTQNFQGNGLHMNFGKGTGGFQGAFLNLQTNDVTQLIATTTGSIGIGTSSPFYATSSVANVTTHRGIQIESGALMQGKQFPMILLQTSGASDAGNTWYITGQNSVTTAGSAADFDFGMDTGGNLYLDGSNNAGLADFAEWFPAKNDRANLKTGDLVSLDGSSLVSMVKKSPGTPYDPHVLGIVSTKPGFIAGGGSVEDSHENDVMVALSGRVSLKISTEGGPVHIGDRLTSSSLPGIAMKATTSGMTVGIALEAFDGSNALSEGTIGVETNRVTEQSISKTTHTIKKAPHTNFGGEVTNDALQDVAIEENISTSTSTLIVPKQKPAEELAVSSGRTVKVGKVLVFVNLGWTQLDATAQQLAMGSSAAGPANAWSVDQSTGKVNVGFRGNVDLGGNDILNVANIISDNGKWSIGHDGKLVVEEVQAKRGTFEDSLNVGTSAKPTGFTIYDGATGEPYCVQVVHGALQSIAGVCGSGSVPSSSPSPSPTLSPSPTSSSMLESPSPSPQESPPLASSSPFPEPPPPTESPQPVPTPESSPSP